MKMTLTIFIMQKAQDHVSYCKIITCPYTRESDYGTLGEGGFEINETLSEITWTGNC